MKKTLYPKTKRISNESVIITEKLDGGNLGIFKLNDKIYFAQRNHVLEFRELTKENAYKGLRAWASDNIESLNELHNESCVFGEWIGMGKIGYGETDINKRFYIFAKANVDENFDIRNLNYQRELFIYPFESQVIPESIGVVPVVKELKTNLSISLLNDLYEQYKEEKDRNVEGFVIYSNGGVQKYVRMKNGKLSNHKS